MILTLDSVNNKMKLTSIMRDSYVNIGDRGLDKINHAYASGGDYKRTERQRDVINAVFEKLKSTPVTQYPSLISEFLPFIQTNMSSSDLLGLATEFAGLIPSGLQQDRFPRDGQDQGQTINGIYYLTFDIPKVRESMKEYIFEDK